MKKSRLYVGISLMVQAFSFTIMFIILCAKKKSIAGAFLAVAAMAGTVGTYMLWQYREDEKAFEASFGDDFLDDEDFDFDEDAIHADLFGGDDAVQKDTDASEADFQ